jgi:hypothetical protein
MAGLVRVTGLPAIAYFVAAAAVPTVAYAIQPRTCFDHLFLPYVLPVVVMLCLAAGAVQSFVRLPHAVKAMTGVVFALAIHGMVLVPCISSLEDSARIMRLVRLGLGMAWVSASVLWLVAAGLLRSGRPRVARTVAAIGFAAAGASLAVGATKQYLGFIGVIWTPLTEALAEARMPTLLMSAVGVAAVGVTFALVQQHRNPAPGAGG